MIDNNYDAVGLLLCIRVTYQNLRIVQKRRIPCLDPYLNAINMLLWPRFQSIMDMHIDSLKKAVASKLLPTKDTHPHYVKKKREIDDDDDIVIRLIVPLNIIDYPSIL
jgi:hypothetical protein